MIGKNAKPKCIQHSLAAILSSRSAFSRRGSVYLCSTCPGFATVDGHVCPERKHCGSSMAILKVPVSHGAKVRWMRCSIIARSPVDLRGKRAYNKDDRV